MFAKTIIDSDAFIDMPVTARLLYYDLAMRADDDGFVNSPKKIMRMIGASQDDISILILRKFIIPFDNGVVVIKHWRIHNYIQKDRYKPTKYEEELAMLTVKDNGAYSLDTECIQDVSTLDTQVRLGKVSIGKVSLGKDNNSPKSEQENQWFEAFWKMYPRKEGKQNAMKAFEKMCNSEDTYNAIMDGLQKRVKLDWSRRPPEEKKFIPHPTTWLNQSRWNDEVTPYAGKGEGIFAGMTGKPEDYSEPSAEYEKSIEEFFGE